MDDGGVIVHDDWRANATTVVRRALKEPEEKVLVHGHMGVNRGPSLAFATLLTQGWDPVESSASICRAWPVTYMHYDKNALDWCSARTASQATHGVTSSGASTAGRSATRW